MLSKEELHQRLMEILLRGDESLREQALDEAVTFLVNTAFRDRPETLTDSVLAGYRIQQEANDVLRRWTGGSDSNSEED